MVRDFKRTSLLYPQSNRLVEKKQNNKNIKCKDYSLGLLIHWTTPGEHGLSPAEMFLGRQIKKISQC